MSDKVADKLEEFRSAAGPLPTVNHVWPLYGAGFENLGKDDKPIEVPMPTYGPDELLVRHDACSLCFSDIKVISQGEKHPRIHRDMKQEPVVLGHEVTLVVVGVGENLRDKYTVGDRFIVQADIWVKGKGFAYGYMIQGGLSEYNVIDQRVLNGDDGNYLIPVQPTTGYAESALVEPWACVIAAYQLKYRTAMKNGGTAWVIGTSRALSLSYTIGAGFDEQSHPARLMLSNVPEAFAAWLRQRAATLGIEVVEVSDLANPPATPVDDIILLGADADTVEKVSPFLADFGIVALIDNQPPARPVSIDMGRVHYNRWLYVGGTQPDIGLAYSTTPARSTLKPGGRAWFVGAGGPMGRMHVQRAIQMQNGPSVIVCTDVSELRLNDLRQTFAEEARSKGIEFVCLNPMEKEAYEKGIAPYIADGFDDVIVLAPVAPVIADASHHVAKRGIMNVFAGVARGTLVTLDLGDVYLKDIRHFGHSASTIDDMRLMLSQAESGQLSPSRVVAAVGSLNAAKDGLNALKDASFPGKVVIYPHIKELPLTPLADLKEKMPTVFAKLRNGREWNDEAEAEFLRLMLS